MKRMIHRVVAMLFASITVMSMCAVPAMATVSAQFSSRNSYCEVRISDNLLNKRGKQYATVKLQTYNSPNATWLKTNGKVNVIMRDEYGRHIWSGVKNGGDTLKLGDDHRVYRIYVSVYYEPSGGFWGWIADSNNFINSGKCVSWKFLNPKDCTIR